MIILYNSILAICCRNLQNFLFYVMTVVFSNRKTPETFRFWGILRLDTTHLSVFNLYLFYRTSQYPRFRYASSRSGHPPHRLLDDRCNSTCLLYTSSSLKGSSSAVITKVRGSPVRFFAKSGAKYGFSLSLGLLW